MSPSETLSSSTDFLDVQLYGFPAPPISRRDKEGFSSCLACPYHRAVALTPPGWLAATVSLRWSMLPSPSSWGLGPRESTFEATYAFTFVTARWLAITPRMMPSIGFRNLVSLLPAIQATRLLTLTSVGFYTPLNTPALAGHTTGRARFEHPAFRQTSPT